MPGVRAVLTEADLTADGVGELPCITILDAVEPLIVPPRPALARDRVRHVGDPVAFIVAETLAQAVDAADAMLIEYDPLPCVVDGPSAVQPGAPQLWTQAPGNSAFLFHKGDEAAVAAAMSTAAHVVECELINNRVVVAPMETRAAVGAYDPVADSLHLTLTGQAVHGIRQQLADAIFQLPRDRIRVTVPDVGGGFGMKNFMYPEWVLVLWAARRLGQPVRWVSERVEDFISSTHGRDIVTRARLALDASGRIIALEARTVANMGAYLSTNGPLSPTLPAASAMGGVYDIPAIWMEVRGAFTNTPPVDAYRGAGKPEANFIIERLIDIAAAQTGIDAVTLRRRNIISSFPHRTAMGMLIDGGRFGKNLDDAVRVADWDGFFARREASSSAGLLRGIGIACFLETARGTPNEVARIAFETDGTVSVAVGTQSNGQGHETTYIQLAADMLGLPMERFRFHQGDTCLLPSGGGHGGARSMHLGGTALVFAVEQLLQNAQRIAALLLQTTTANVIFDSGRFLVKDSGRSIEIDTVAAAARDPANVPEGVPSGLQSLASNISDVYTFPNGCHVAEVEIDPETGVVRLDRYTLVDDFGRILNPLLAIGQIHGGIVQGIGQAMMEHVVFDPDSAQLLSASFMDYALPRAGDLPFFDGHLVSTSPTTVNRLGVKGTGQAGCIAAPQTIMNAIVNALAPVGIASLDMPATPQRVWQAIQKARGA